MTREIVIALAGGLVSGALYVALATGSLGGIMFAYLSQVPLFLVGLSVGLPSLLTAGAISILVVAVAAGVTAAGLIAATSVLPILILVRQALLNRPTTGGHVEWFPPGLLVGWLTILGASGVLVAGVFLSSYPGGAEAAVSGMIADAVRAMAAPGSFSDEEIAALSAGLGTIFLGTAAISWMIMIAVNGSLAQGVLAGFGQNLRPSPDISDIEIPRWIYYALAAALLIAVAASGTLGYIARNSAIAFATAFFFQGLGVLHSLARRWSARAVSLIVIYLVLIVFGWPVLAVTALGLAEPLLKLRTRFKRTDRE